MPTRSADVAFTADVDGYTTSLTQAIEATNQYSKAADTLLGKLAKLGGAASNLLITKTDKLSQANKVSTAQAAAYQQQLSKLDATATVLGKKTFPAIEKATMSLGRSFPIGIGQAVDQMEALQESGLGASAGVVKIATAYTQLGAATGTYGPAIGKQMTELTRTMGNQMGMVGGYNDSLVKLNATYGGSASGVLAFSKSLAPIASTVGIGQTRVMGLSTAFSRLGEDGYAAGNAVNKVMIDLNKSVREGSPEIREYAALMGKSVSELRQEFTNDPSKVIVDFTESINKSGPDAIRTMNALGLEGVRTVKAISSLSKEGNLGEILDTAGQAFGDGSSVEAAKKAMGGVNDQIAMINESMSQLVAGAGKPFLGVMEDILKVSRAIASTTAKITLSEPAQKLGLYGQAGLAAGSFAMNAVSTATMLSLGIRGTRYVGRKGREFQRGALEQAMAAEGQLVTPQQPTWASRLGTRFADRTGTTTGSLLFSPAALGEDITERTARSVRGAGRLTANAALLAMNTAASQMRQDMGQPGYTSPGGQAMLAGWRGTGRAILDRDPTSAFVRGSTATADTFRRMTGRGADLGTFPEAARRLGTSTARVYGSTARALGSVGTGVLQATGLAGMGTAGLATVGAAGLGYAAYKASDRAHTNERAMTEAAGDPMAKFNEFAERAGYATKSISSLGEAAEKAARALVATENKEPGSEYQMSSAEMGEASKTGRAVAFTTKAPTAQDAAVVAYGSNMGATGEQVAQMGIDVQTQLGGTAGQQFLDEMKRWRTGGGGGITEFAAAAANSAVNREGLFGQNANSAEAMKAAQSAYQQRWAGAGTDAAGQRMRAKDLEGLFARAQDEYGKGNTKQADNLNDLLDALTGVKRGMVENNPASNFQEYLGKYADQGSVKSIAQARDSMMRGEALPAWKERPLDTERRTTDGITGRLTNSVFTLGKTMVAANELAEQNNVAVADLTDQQKVSLTETERAISASRQNVGDAGKLYAAARLYAEQAMAESGGSTIKARAGLVGQLASANEADGTAQIVETTLAMLPQTRASVTEQAGMSRTARWNQAIQAGDIAEAQTLPETASPKALAAQQEAIAGRSQALAEQADAARSYMIQVRDTSKGIARETETFQITQQRQQKDFNRQRAWAAADFNHSQWLSERNFNQQMAWQNQQYNITVYRANRDFALQQQYAAADFHKTQYRATRDFNRQQEWAQRDYRITVSRSNRDFYRQQEWGREEHNRTEARAEFDFKKTMRRQEEAYELSVSRTKRDFATARARQEEQYQITVSRAYRDFAKSMLRQQEQYEIEVGRAQRDNTKGLARSEQDYLRQRNYAYADHDRQLARQIKDNAKSMYDPYTRAMHQQVWDTTQLLANMREQNALMAKQKESVDKLKSAGLSQNAIDLFSLTDTKNAQQAMRMAAEAMTDPSLIEKLNQQVAGRIDLSKAFTTDSTNEAYRRQEEDFAIAMQRAAEEHQIAVSRTSEDFATAMADMAANNSRAVRIATEDFTTSMADLAQSNAIAMRVASEDLAVTLADMAKNNAISVTQAVEDNREAMRRLNQDYAISVEQAATLHRTQMSDMAKDFAKQMSDSKVMFKTQMSDAETDYATSVERAKKAHDLQMADMAQSQAISVAQANTLHEQAMAEAERQFGISQDRELTLFEQSLERAREDLRRSQAWTMADLATAATDMTAGMTDVVSATMAMISKLPEDMQPKAKEALTTLMDAMGVTITEGQTKNDGTDAKAAAVFDGVVAGLTGDQGTVEQVGRTSLENYLKGVDGKTADVSAKAAADNAIMVDGLKGSDADFMNVGKTRLDNMISGMDAKDSAVNVSADGLRGTAEKGLIGARDWAKSVGEGHGSGFALGTSSKTPDATAAGVAVSGALKTALVVGNGQDWAAATGKGLMDSLAAGVTSKKDDVGAAASGIKTLVSNWLAYGSAEASGDNLWTVTRGEALMGALAVGIRHGITSENGVNAASAEAHQALAQGKDNKGLMATSGENLWTYAAGKDLAESLAAGFGSKDMSSVGDAAAAAIAAGIKAHKIEADIVAKVKVQVSGGGDENAPGATVDGPSSSGRYPVAGASGHRPWYRYASGRYHGGADIGASKGTRVFSASDGKVIGKRVITDHQSSTGSYGRYLVITDGARDFYYAHMSAYATGLDVGDTVKAGQLIGAVGNTGHTLPIGSGYHLHFEVRPRGAGHRSAIDPNPWLADGGVATRHQLAHVGEAGPEAIIPLNRNGADYLMDVLNRYMSGNEARFARTAPYATTVNVTNNTTYDQSTKVTGAITVVSNSPTDMARQLAAKTRRDRLVGTGNRA